MPFKTVFILPLLLAGLLACAPNSAPESETISIYSARHYDSDQMLYDAFTAKTRIEVRVREGKSAGLLETMKTEGEKSPADIIIAADAGSLWRFQQAGLLQPVRSDLLEATIPAVYREADGYWFGVSKRARIIAYDPTRIEPGLVKSYRAFTDASVQGEVCIRSSSNIYNLSLMAELIERWGAEEATRWAGATRAHFARPPSGGDTAQLESIAAGECAIALVNHYYWVRLATHASAEKREIAQKVALSFPSEGMRTHINVTGAGLAAHAPNPAGGRAFLEFLISPEGQALLITETKEYPILESVARPVGLEGFAPLPDPDISLSVYGRHQIQAQMIYDQVGWN